MWGSFHLSNVGCWLYPGCIASSWAAHPSMVRIKPCSVILLAPLTLLQSCLPHSPPTPFSAPHSPNHCSPSRHRDLVKSAVSQNSGTLSSPESHGSLWAPFIICPLFPLIPPSFLFPLTSYNTLGALPQTSNSLAVPTTYNVPPWDGFPLFILIPFFP